MKTTLPNLACVLFALLLVAFVPDRLVKTLFTQAEQQTRLMLGEIGSISQTAGKPTLVSPRTLTAEGTLQAVPARDWTSGFFPGEL